MSFIIVLVSCLEDMVKTFITKITWATKYKDMYTILEAIIKDNFNIAYGRLKNKYANNSSVLKYIEKDWTRHNISWKIM